MSDTNKRLDVDTDVPLAARELRIWRAGYRHHLEANGVAHEQAAILADKVAYRADLYPTAGEQSSLPLFGVVATDKENAALVDGKPVKAKPPRAKAAEHTQGMMLSMQGQEIESTPPTSEDMAFTHAVLCQVGLPRSKVAGESFLRKSGTAWVNVQAGMLDEGKGPVQQPIPYGAIPRLALAWVSTYAKRYNSREIPIGDSANDFLRLMGMDIQGNRHTTLRKQMHALAACRLQLGYAGRTYNGQPVEQFDAWINNKNLRQKALWPGVMVLSEGYFKELVEHGVPLDNRALHALKGSALALDVYTWLAHRLHRIEGRPVTLHWKSLREQFAQEYQGKDPDKDFKKEFVPALRAALSVYPGAHVKRVNGGLLLQSSPPPIAYKNA